MEERRGARRPYDELEDSASVATSAVRFALDSPLEGTGFEPSVPREETTLTRQPAATGIPFGRKRPTHSRGGSTVRTPFPPAPDLSQGCFLQLSGVVSAGSA